MMARPTGARTDAVASNTLPVTAAIAGALIVLVWASDASAQKGADANYLVVDGLDTCGEIVDAPTNAEVMLQDGGWFIEDIFQNGPFVLEISASRIYDDGSDAYVFAIIETYPSAEIGYCSFDVQAVGGTVDLGVVGETYETNGMVEPGEFGIHGTWEAATDDAVYLVLGNYEADAAYLFLQMTRVGDAAIEAPPRK